MTLHPEGTSTLGSHGPCPRLSSRTLLLRLITVLPPLAARKGQGSPGSFHTHPTHHTLKFIPRLGADIQVLMMLMPT